MGAGGNTYVGNVPRQMHCVLEMNWTVWQWIGEEEAEEVEWLTSPAELCHLAVVEGDWEVFLAEVISVTVITRGSAFKQNDNLLLSFSAWGCDISSKQSTLLQIQVCLQIFQLFFDLVLVCFNTIYWFRKASYFQILLMGTLNPHWYIRCPWEYVDNKYWVYW